MSRAAADDDQLRRYARSRRSERGAASYATKYERELHKRMSSRVERRVIARALARTGLRDARVLDLPCGAGRLAPELAPVAGSLLGADYSPAMLGHFRRAAGAPCVAADALQLPFADGAFDLVFSARLSHHIGDPALRERYLAELARVAAGWVVVTAFDPGSLKNRTRELRRRLGSRKRSKHTLSREAVERVSRKAGFEVAAAFPLSRLFSGHVYYVLRRAEPPARRPAARAASAQRAAGERSSGATPGP